VNEERHSADTESSDGISTDGAAETRARSPLPPLHTSEQLGERRRRAAHHRRWRRSLIALVIVAVPLALLAISYASYMAMPSSLPWNIRSVEYLRDHHMAWLVNDVENFWYSHHAPKEGGPGVTALPFLGAAQATGPRPQPSARPYRPPRVKSAAAHPLKGEGVWTPVGRAVNGVFPILATTFRNERDYPGILTYAVWIDATRTRLALYPGRYEPPSANPRGPMMIPVSQRLFALAAFNSGFKQKDGGGGWIINGHTDSTMYPGRGTVVAYPDGRVDVMTWRSGIPARAVVLARQNLPLIVIKGKPNPELSVTQQWGYTLHNAVRVWRTAVGVDARGNLIYVAADGQTAPSIAGALVRAGAVRGIELDINAEWPTFNVYRRPGCKAPVMIVPNYQQSARRYLVPDDRDFFVVYTRTGSTDFAVPLK
jgi:hypothetical protein